MSETAVEHYLTEQARLAPESGPSWLRQQRQAAAETFSRLGFPTLRNEDWKYTDVRPITKRSFRVTQDPAPEPDSGRLDALRFPELDCHELIFINGRHAARSSRLDGLEDDITIQSLGNMLQQQPDRLETYLNRYNNTDKNGFVALNTAFMHDGAVILIPDNVQMAKPLHLIFLSDHQEEPHVSLPRNLIVLGNNSRATVIESYFGVDDAEYFTNTNTEVILNNGAALEHYKIQREGLKGYHVGTLQVRQQRDSRMESHSISLGGRLARNDIDVGLADTGAEVFLNGLYMADKRQHVDNHTRIDHLSPHTTSVENYRGILNGHGRGVFNGKVMVHKDAQKISADQSNANLLLSNDAEVDTKPELEIYADDVQCSHGATTGQLDENMLFYLRSRAISEEVARNLLTFAFADDVITRLRLKPVRDQLEYLVVGQLPDSEQIREFIQ